MEPPHLGFVDSESPKVDSVGATVGEEAAGDEASMAAAENRKRFLVELEFVQCLTNLGYLHCESKFSAGFI